MKRRLLSLVAVMAVATVAVVAYQQSGKGMIVAEPGLKSLTREQVLSGLVQFTECSVLVENLPDALKDALTRDDIETWVRNRLVNAGLKVVTETEQDLEFLRALRLATTDEATLRAEDRHRSYVYVNIGGLKDPSDKLFYTVDIEAHRGVFMHPGYFKQAAVWDTGSYGLLGPAHDIKTKLRDKINGRMDIFEAAWKKANR